MSVVLSPIWHHLPQEIVETILTHHVDSFIDRDPALAWVQLRQISGYQLRRIERHFRQHWLPKMSITLYSPDAGCWSIEYFFHAFDEDNKKIVIFAAEELALNSWPVFTQGFEPAATILDVWADFARSPINKRNITVRLGEGVLSGGYHGGYIVNDTDLPGLQHPPRAEQGRYVQFDWMRAMNELLREEMFMRNVADKMLANAFTRASGGDLNGEQLPPVEVQIKLWVQEIQMGRRVAVQKHRASKLNGDGAQLHFSKVTSHLHRQPPPPSGHPHGYDSECRTCSAKCRPDIFELLAYEESIVPQLSFFKDGVCDPPENGSSQFHKRIIDLYADARGWAAAGSLDNSASNNGESRDDIVRSTRDLMHTGAAWPDVRRWRGRWLQSPFPPCHFG